MPAITAIFSEVSFITFRMAGVFCTGVQDFVHMVSTHFPIAGLTIGLLTGYILFYLALYRRLRQKNIKNKTRLTQLEIKLKSINQWC